MSESLRSDELNPVDGSWTGLLFENPATGYPLALTWTFTIDFASVSRDFGSVSPNLSIDWVPLPGSTWHSMNGREVAGKIFGEPIETSIYFFEHYRYDSVELAVIGQRTESIDIRATVAGDFDGLGIAELSIETALSFGGIYVQLDEVGTNVEAAESRLAEYTDTSRLRGHARDQNVVFEVGNSQSGRR